MSISRIPPPFNVIIQNKKPSESALLTEGEYTISAVPPQFIPQSAVTRATRIRLLSVRRTSSGMYSSRRGCPFSPAKGSLKRCCGSTSFRHSILQYIITHFRICQVFYCTARYSRHFSNFFSPIPFMLTSSSTSAKPPCSSR